MNHIQNIELCMTFKIIDATNTIFDFKNVSTNLILQKSFVERM